MTEVDKENVRTATPGAVKPAATKRATRASTRNARGVLRWGETLETLFLLDDAAHPERRALADRVVARPDDPNAWWQLLSDVAESGKRDARCRLFRRATQSIPKNRPELYEAEAYVSIWLGFVKAQTGLGQRQDALDALQYMRNEGIGKRSRAFYETWALCEAGAGKAAAAKEALQAGIRALPARERKSVVALAACSDAELAAQAAALAGAAPPRGPEDDATGVISVRVDGAAPPADDDMDVGEDTVVLPPPVSVVVDTPGPGRSASATDETIDVAVALKSSKAPMKREDIDYMLKWKPSKGGRSASKAAPRRVSFAKTPEVKRAAAAAAADKSAAKEPMPPTIEEAAAPSTASSQSGTQSSGATGSSRAGVESSDEDSDAEDLPSRSTASTHSTSGGPARTPGESTATLEVGAAGAFGDLVSERNTLKVEGQCYAKLALVGRGGSSKVFRVLGADGRVLALKRIKLRGSEVDHSFAGYANEVALLQRLRGKENIVTLYAADVDRAAGSIHMVMEAGDADLATVLSQRRDAAARAAAAGDARARGDDGNFVRLTWQQMLEAVHTIHEERIVHGDLKPANFLFVQGRLKLIDFGIARAIKNDTTNIYRDTQIGTLNYMSPEAIRDSGAGPRGAGPGAARKPTMRVGRASDVWSLGCILYQMVYGKTPFGDLHLYAKLQAITNPTHVIDFPPRGPLATPDALACLAGCLAREPAHRPPIVDAARGLLSHAFLNPVSAPPAAPRAAAPDAAALEAAVAAALPAGAAVDAAAVARAVAAHLAGDAPPRPPPPPLPAAAARSRPPAPTSALAADLQHQQSKLQAVETSTSAKYMRDAPADDDEDGDGLLSVMSRGFARMQPVKEDAGEDMDTSHTASWTTH